MAFDNLQFRSCSFNYNHNGIADDPAYITEVASFDIGNGANKCLKFQLSPLNTVWNEDVSVSAQVEVYFQAVVVADSSGNTTADSPSWLSKVPVEQRQGLFRLPRYYSADGSNTKTVYRAYKENDGLYYLYIDTTIVKGLHKTTRTDGSTILGYPVTGAAEGSPVDDLYFPEPTTASEFTVKRLTHSITDFVTYQAGGQLTSNLLNFQKEQEMSLIQEILWTIEMDMLTFSDLSGFGSIVTGDSDGIIDSDQIRLSLYNLTDTQAEEGTDAQVVLYKDVVGGTWVEKKKTELIAYGDLSDVTIDPDTLTGGHVVFYDATDGWKNGTVSDAVDSCSAKDAETLTFCLDPVVANRTIQLDGIIVGGGTWDKTSDTTLVTASGITEVPIDDLNNVTITTPAANQVLYYDDTGSGAWKNINLSSLTTGILGPAGGDTFKFNLDYNDTVAPASGEIILLQSNGTTAATTWATTAFIKASTTDANSAAISSWLDSLDDGTSDVKGNIKIFKEGTPSQYAIYNLTAVTGTSTVRTLAVTHVSSNTDPSADMAVYFTMSYKGDKGDRGTDGDDGADGTDGIQGFQGIGFTDTATAALENSDQDIRFTFNREDPAGTSPSATEVVLADFNGSTNVQVLYIKSFKVNTSGYGFYEYTLNTAANGSGTDYAAVNYMEIENAGSSGSNRTFGGITYANTPGATNDRITGTHTVTNDVIQLQPVGNPAPADTTSTPATYSIPVYCKTSSGTHNGFSYVRSFSMQNIHYITQCG